MSADLLAVAAQMLPPHVTYPWFGDKEGIETMQFVLGRDVLPQASVPATVAAAAGAQVNWWQLNMSEVRLVSPVMAVFILNQMMSIGLPQQIIEKTAEVFRPFKPRGFHAFITTLDGDGNPLMCDHGLATKHVRSHGQHAFETVEVGNIGLQIKALAFDPKASTRHAVSRGHVEETLSTTAFDAHFSPKDAGEIMGLYHKGVDRLRVLYAAPLATVRQQMEEAFPREFTSFLPNWGVKILGAAATRHLILDHARNSNAQARDKATILGIAMPHQCLESTTPGVTETFFDKLAERDRPNRALWENLKARRAEIELTSLTQRSADVLALA